MKRTMTDDEAGQYGFRWGQVDVTRLAELPDGSKVISVKTDTKALEIYVTPGGRRIDVRQAS